MTCRICQRHEDLRAGICFDCATDAERRAAQRSVLQHLLKGLGKVMRLRFNYGTRTDFRWAWERLTRTGDYAPGGEFERQYGLHP